MHSLSRVADSVDVSSNPLAIFDGHNDVTLALYGAIGRKPRTFTDRSSDGHLDLPRAREGGMVGGFFSIWVPPDPAAGRRPEKPVENPAQKSLDPMLDHYYALRMGVGMAAPLFRLEREGVLRITRNYSELTRCLEKGTLAAILHLEGAEPIDEQLNSLELFYAAGLRSLGPVHFRRNQFGEGVPERFPSSPDTGPGLTDLGKQLVRACNELGILVDLSHITERGFWDVASLTTAPLVATHSNAHALTPHARNLLDSQLDAIKESGGVIGINFEVTFVREDGTSDPNTPLSDVVRHFAYIADRIGVEHVAFGSDFDGADIPAELGDAGGLPRLVSALRAHGFGEADLKKIALENWLRVLQATWLS